MHTHSSRFNASFKRDLVSTHSSRFNESFKRDSMYPDLVWGWRLWKFHLMGHHLRWRFQLTGLPLDCRLCSRNGSSWRNTLLGYHWTHTWYLANCVYALSELLDCVVRCRRRNVTQLLGNSNQVGQVRWHLGCRGLGWYDGRDGTA